MDIDIRQEASRQGGYRGGVQVRVEWGVCGKCRHRIGHCEVRWGRGNVRDRCRVGKDSLTQQCAMHCAYVQLVVAYLQMLCRRNERQSSTIDSSSETTHSAAATTGSPGLDLHAQQRRINAVH